MDGVTNHNTAIRTAKKCFGSACALCTVTAGSKCFDLVPSAFDGFRFSSRRGRSWREEIAKINPHKCVTPPRRAKLGPMALCLAACPVHSVRVKQLLRVAKPQRRHERCLGFELQAETSRPQDAWVKLVRRLWRRQLAKLAPLWVLREKIYEPLLVRELQQCRLRGSPDPV